MVKMRYSNNGLIEGGISENAIIIEKAAANNIWVYLDGMMNSEEFDPKEEFDEFNLEKIAEAAIEKHLFHDGGILNFLPVGKNTLVVSTNYDYTDEVEGKGELRRTVKNVEEQEKNVYIFIEKGVKLNGKRHRTRIVQEIGLDSPTLVVPSSFSDRMKSFKYNDEDISDAYSHLMGGQLRYPISNLN